jgi:hypothetical protein
LRAVAGAEGSWIAELRVRQLKIGRKSCFDGYLRFEENGKIPIFFKPKVAIAEFFWKIQRKNLLFYFRGGHHASFPQKLFP